MKRLLLISLITLLTGCASINKLIDSYRMARFDNNEYSLVTQIHTLAQVGVTKCSTADAPVYADTVYVKSLELRNYSASIPENKDTITMTIELLAITKGLKDRYASGDPVSQKYCELKFNNIENSSGTMKTVIGAKPR
jgi:uncharacterized protein YceK